MGSSGHLWDKFLCTIWFLQWKLILQGLKFNEKAQTKIIEFEIKRKKQYKKIRRQQTKKS